MKKAIYIGVEELPFFFNKEEEEEFWAALEEVVDEALKEKINEDK